MHIRLLRILVAVTLLIFNFQSLTKANDIRDLKIEGISIGDSALDHFDKSKIKSGIKIYGKDKSIYKVEIDKSTKEFDGIGFYFKKNDTKYIIKGLSAAVFTNNFKECKRRMKKLENDLSSVLNNAQKDSMNYKHPIDNKSLVYQTLYSSKGLNGSVSISCYDWDKVIEVNKNWSDHLAVELYDTDTEYWITHLAH